MGTDVHFFLEIRKNEGPWDIHPKCEGTSIAALSGRSYVLFSLIAGVRSHGSKILFPPRGLPEDASDYIKTYFEASALDYGYHTPSWLTPKELKFALDKWVKMVKNEYESVPSMKDPYRDPFNEPYRIDFTPIMFINQTLDWEKAENLILGTNNKTEFRFIFFFDS